MGVRRRNTRTHTAAAAVIPYKRTVLFQLKGSKRTSRVVIDGKPIINLDFIFFYPSYTLASTRLKSPITNGTYCTHRLVRRSV